MASYGSAPSTRGATLAASQSRAVWRYVSRSSSSATAAHLGERHAPIGRVLARHAEEAFGDQVALHLVAAAGERPALAHQVLDARGGGAGDGRRPSQLEAQGGDAHGAGAAVEL